MSKLLSRSSARLSSAKSNWDKRNYDDAYVDLTCFDLKQSMEFALKYLIEMNGERYVTTHDLNAQLNKIDKMNIHDPVLEKVRLKSYVYNSWETESRYKDSFIPLAADVEEAISVCKELILFVESNTNQKAELNKLTAF